MIDDSAMRRELSGHLRDKSAAAPDQSTSGTVGPWAEPRRTLVLGALLFAAIIAGYRYQSFSVLRSDVGGYAAWSHDLFGRAGGWHLPGYPMLIAGVRWGTLNWIPDAILMQALCAIGWTLGVLMVDQLLARERPELRKPGTLIWGLFPFVGVTSVAYPLADQWACTTFVAAVAFAREGRTGWLLVVSALGLLIHMALWPFLFCLGLACLATGRMRPTQLVAIGAPLMLYYIAMALRADDALWFFRVHYRVNFKPHSGSPIFNAVLGTFAGGGVSGIIKGCLLLGCVAGAGLMAWWTIRRRDWLMLACCLPLVLYGMVLNVQEGWALMRFGRLLVLPMFLSASVGVAGRLQFLDGHRGIRAVLVAGLAGSQLAWAAYEVHYHMVAQ